MKKYIIIQKYDKNSKALDTNKKFNMGDKIRVEEIIIMQNNDSIESIIRCKFKKKYYI